jgi:tRNA (guanosine-2'-O-)-methyltransferase
LAPPSLPSTPFTFGGRTFRPAEVIECLAPFVGEARQARIEAVVAARTVRVVPVLERVVALEGEAAEWSRSLEAGEGEAVTVEGGTPAQRQSQGADKWLDLYVWLDAETACDGLKAQGYRIAATHLDADAVPIADVDFTVPTALVFGNERDGISDALLARADLNVVLPIDGFIQSYNISVAAALGLYHARQDRIARQGHHGDLSNEDRERLTARYYLRSVRAADRILARFA